jgi:hypothetical protein
LLCSNFCHCGLHSSKCDFYWPSPFYIYRAAGLSCTCHKTSCSTHPRFLRIRAQLAPAGYGNRREKPACAAHLGRRQRTPPLSLSSSRIFFTHAAVFAFTSAANSLTWLLGVPSARKRPLLSKWLSIPVYNLLFIWRRNENRKTGFSCLLKTSRLKLKKLKFENIKIRKMSTKPKNQMAYYRKPLSLKTEWFTIESRSVNQRQRLANRSNRPVSRFLFVKFRI